MGIAWGDVDENILSLDKKIKSCESVDMVVLPELFASGCDMRKIEREVKTALKDSVASRYDQIVDKMLSWAYSCDAAIVGSTIYKESGLYYNRLIVALPSGDTLIYDKHNCYAKGSFAAGEKDLLFEWRGVRFSTYICYDLRFEEWSANNGRYDAAIYIANWPESRAEDWEELLRSRAMENSAYVVAVNCVGDDLAGNRYMGFSQYISPQGAQLAKLPYNSESIAIVNIPIKDNI